MTPKEKQGYDDFYRGKDLNENPHPQNTEERREWEKGNWEAYDDYKKDKERN